jgi:hypothetical protein
VTRVGVAEPNFWVRAELPLIVSCSIFDISRTFFCTIMNVGLGIVCQYLRGVVTLPFAVYCSCPLVLGIGGLSIEEAPYGDPPAPLLNAPQFVMRDGARICRYLRKVRSDFWPELRIDQIRWMEEDPQFPGWYWTPHTCEEFRARAQYWIDRAVDTPRRRSAPASYDESVPMDHGRILDIRPPVDVSRPTPIFRTIPR